MFSISLNFHDTATTVAHNNVAQVYIL